MIFRKRFRMTVSFSGVLMCVWLGFSFAGALVDINSATPDQLKALPGMNDGYIMMIVGARPFQSKEDLIEQKILPQEAYDQVKDQIFVKGGAARSSPPIPATPVPNAIPGAEPGNKREGSDMSSPSGARPARVCIKEERTRELMCGDLIP